MKIGCLVFFVLLFLTSGKAVDGNAAFQLLQKAVPAGLQYAKPYLSNMAQYLYKAADHCTQGVTGVVCQVAIQTTLNKMFTKDTPENDMPVQKDVPWWKCVIDNKSSHYLMPKRISKMKDSGHLKGDFLDVVPGTKVTHEWEYKGGGPHGGGGTFYYEIDDKVLKINVYVANSKSLSTIICEVSIEYPGSSANSKHCATSVAGEYVNCGHGIRYILMIGEPISCTIIYNGLR